MSPAAEAADQGHRANSRPVLSYPQGDQEHHGLEAESHTAQRLRHALPSHLQNTTRRVFIGPVPKGWASGQQKPWYKKRLSLNNYSSRAATFSVDPSIGQPQHTTTRLEPSDLAFPQASINRHEESEMKTAVEGSEESDQHKTNVIQSDPMTAVISQAGTEPRSSNLEDFQIANVDSSTDTQSSTDYVTARERLHDKPEQGQASSSRHVVTNLPHRRTGKSVPKSPNVSTDVTSTTSLLYHQERQKGKSPMSDVAPNALRTQDPESDDMEEDKNVMNKGLSNKIAAHISSGVARFHLDDDVLDTQQRLHSHIERIQENITWPQKHTLLEGEIVTAEKMLVRVEETLNEIPDDYSETVSMRTETHVIGEWKEYLVVCRRSSQEQMSYALKIYKTRVIKSAENSGLRNSSCYDISLNRKHTKVNLFSPLDKTIAIWHPHKRGTRIFILRPRSAARSVEWYTFIHHSLGWHRPSALLINVPDLDISLAFRRPFEQPDLGCDSLSDGKQMDQAREQLAAASIIRDCIEILQNQPEWSDVLNAWSKFEKMGLAWKRYDRLEWVCGVNERQMYGAIAMQMSHDLELRPKNHYPTFIKDSEGNRQEEPSPVEGFLVRLTSQQGVQQRMRKMFFKRLFFFTQDHFLFFCKPAKAALPLKLILNHSNISNHGNSDETRLQYEINPFPVENGHITWLNSGNKEFIRKHDEDAFAESQRNIRNLSNCEGYVDLCSVREVRHILHDTPTDPYTRNEGHDRDNVNVDEFRDGRRFELVLDNGLVVRLLAYNSSSRDKWIKRLNGLVKYWKARLTSDAAELKIIRQWNLRVLGIDEEMESILGQFAKKWEVKRAEASPHLYNMCAVSDCRAIKMSGLLYRKPRRRATFGRCHVVLTAGQLLIFQDSLRKYTGAEIPHTHKTLHATLDLRDCYIYSGLLTEVDLLYSNQTFDSNHPGHRALPRVYPSQGSWTSQDEDTAICFAIWHPLRKSLFRATEAKEDGRTSNILRRVSALGVTGRTAIFKARSRTERDRWVLSIEAEIDRLQEERREEIRVVQ